MKIGYVSDLHLEFGIDGLNLPGGDLLLLAGDIIVARSLTLESGAYFTRKYFYEMLEKQFSKYKKVISIMGNHEHYHNVLPESKKMIEHATAMYPFYTTIENEVVDIIPGWKLFGATMWTDLNNNDYFATYAARKGMSDHHIIRMNEKSKFTTDDALLYNKQSTDDLVRALENHPDDNFIVMTHHTPSFKSCHPRWGGPEFLLNYAFHNTQLEKIIQDYPRIKYWIHGHTHDSFDYMLGDCRVLCNPRGYQGHELNSNFDTSKSFEV